MARDSELETELCHLKDCGRVAVIGTTEVWGPEYRVAMCEFHVMERIRRIASLESREGELVAALDSLETVTRSYLQYPLKGKEPGWSAKDVLAYCDEARRTLASSLGEEGMKCPICKQECRSILSKQYAKDYSASKVPRLIRVWYRLLRQAPWAGPPSGWDR